MSLRKNSPADIGLLDALLIDIRLRLISLAIRFCSLRKLASWMSRRFPPNSPPAASTETSSEAFRITVQVLNVNRRLRIFPASCLVESLTLWWMLRRRRIEADLRIGVRTITGVFESHAWVELNGTVLTDIEQVATIYSTIDIIPLAKGEAAK